MQSRKMALHYKKARAKTFCSLEHLVFVLLNDRSRMKGDFHVRFCEKFEVEFLFVNGKCFPAKNGNYFPAIFGNYNPAP